MMTFTLYRSGIKQVMFNFNQANVSYQQLDATSNEWGEENVLTDEKAKEFEAFYHLNPLAIYDQLADFRSIFTTTNKRVMTKEGNVYHKDQTNSYLWVEREKQFPLDVMMVDREPVAFISGSRENCHVLVKEGYEAYTPVALWQNGDVSEAVYTVTHEGHSMVPMRDGVRLATDVWLPSECDHPVPAIFVRTPYGRMSFKNTYVHFIQRGYAVVIQDTRGREDSEGEWMPMLTEMDDGDDALNWIADQPWCDGNIGMIGGSYGGYVQWAAAASGNPHLKALISIVTAGSPFGDLPRKGGALVSGMLAWAFAMVEQRFKPENMLRSDWDEVLKIRPLEAIPRQALGKDVPFWQEWMQHPVNDDFWKRQDWHRHRQKIHVPAMIVSGWYDDNGMGTTEALETVADYGETDRKVILGPWMHKANTTRDIQGVAFGDEAIRYDMDYYFQQWFDRQLKGVENGIDQGNCVEYYVTGENKWTTATHWPPTGISWTNAYLTSDGDAKTSSGNGTLRFEPIVMDGYDEYQYDPQNPAPHIIDMSANEVGVPANYKEAEKREDILVYDTAPVDNPITVVGDMVVQFYASSTAKDTDWVVRVTDVDSEGNSIKLADGVLRARYRHGFDEEVLLESGVIEKYVIRTSKLAHTFQMGHRIRLTITSSAENFVFPNSNTGQDPATDTETIVATQRVYHQANYLSYVQLPVLKDEE